MTGSASFVGKIVYVVVIVVLLVPLYLISHPTTRDDEGGTLARMRTEHRLSQANLGEIDPAGASISLATLGMRGVAANLLWGQAIHYKKTENWDAFKATLNQIIKLQPNFESVWVYQAWNLTYNVSVEFDDYRHRYHWVKKGIDYLIDGTKYNTESPSMLHDVGWFFQHKIGRADEKKQYRRLFRDDKDFHDSLVARSLTIDMENTKGPDQKPDNWLVAKEWYRAGERLVETKDIPIRRKNPVLFFSNAAMALMYHAAAIQEEGYLDEAGRLAWANALEAWTAFGNHGIPSRLGYDVRLNDWERLLETAKQARLKLAELAPGVEEKLRQERIAALPSKVRDAVNTPADERTPEQIRMASDARPDLKVRLNEIALGAPAERQNSARRFAKQAFDAEGAATVIERERNVVNFDYWMTRCESEQSETTASARRHLYDADRFFEDTDFEQARREYELAWQDWAEVYKRFPILMDDVEAEENYDAIKRYRRLLGQLDEQFPPIGFPLMQLLSYFDDEYADIVPSVGTPANGAAPADADSQEASESAVETPTSTPPDDATDAAAEKETTEPRTTTASAETSDDEVSDEEASDGEDTTSVEETNSTPADDQVNPDE